MEQWNSEDSEGRTCILWMAAKHSAGWWCWANPCKWRQSDNKTSPMYFHVVSAHLHPISWHSIAFWSKMVCLKWTVTCYTCFRMREAYRGHAARLLAPLLWLAAQESAWLNLRSWQVCTKEPLVSRVLGQKWLLPELSNSTCNVLIGFLKSKETTMSRLS